jgi:hypothetical protein
VVGCGIVSFQRELMPPLVFKDVFNVPRMKKNMFSVSSIQDRGFEAPFRGTEVLIHPKGSNVTSGRAIDTGDGNLYRLNFRPLYDLASST